MVLGEPISTNLRLRLIQLNKTSKVDALGALFILNLFGVVIDLNSADLVEMVFATDEFHQTWHPDVDLTKRSPRRTRLTAKAKRATAAAALSQSQYQSQSGGFQWTSAAGQSTSKTTSTADQSTSGPRIFVPGSQL